MPVLFVASFAPAELGRYKRDHGPAKPKLFTIWPFTENNLLTPGIYEHHKPQLRWRSSNFEGAVGTRKGSLLSPQSYSML